MRKLLVVFSAASLLAAALACGPLSAVESKSVEKPEEPEQPDASPTSIKSVEVVSPSHFLDQFGDLHIVGYAENTGEIALQFPQVACSLRDAEGSIVDTSSLYPWMGMLAAGESIPFSLSYIDEPDDWQSYDCTVRAQATDRFREYVFRDFEVIGGHGEPNGRGGYEINGEIHNISEYEAKLVEILAALYDANGNLISAGTAAPALDRIPPFETSPFTLTIHYLPEDVVVDHYELLIEGTEAD